MSNSFRGFIADLIALAIIFTMVYYFAGVSTLLFLLAFFTICVIASIASLTVITGSLKGGIKTMWSLLAHSFYLRLFNKLIRK